ncbi:hypothetical protein BRD15_06265 [Halobacteriales archaeon SW_6_65_15]|nr:MAG: hypothetical protein BRD15_06265 [Halobacteriales archaeon SW_6_65_15]
MSMEGVAGEPSRLDRWLDEYAEGLLERKYRLEATYARKRAERAESRDDFETAETYYDRARSLRGKLGDREAAIELGLAHARTAYENDNVGTAQKHYERVVNLHARRENAKGALDALEPLLELLEAEGKDDDLREWWGHTMMVLGKAEPGEISVERRDALIDQYAEQIQTEDSVGRLYGFAVQRFLEGDEETGADLLDATWDRKDVVREAVGPFRVLLAAGVGLVAYAELNDPNASTRARPTPTPRTCGATSTPRTPTNSARSRVKCSGGSSKNWSSAPTQFRGFPSSQSFQSGFSRGGLKMSTPSTGTSPRFSAPWASPPEMA